MSLASVALSLLRVRIVDGFPLSLFSLFFLQEDSEVRWFTLFDGYKAFDPISCNFFALRTVPIAEMDEFVRSAEWEEHKDRYQRPGVAPQ